MSTCNTDNENSTQTVAVTFPNRRDPSSSVQATNVASGVPARPPTKKAYSRHDNGQSSIRHHSTPRQENRFRSGTQEHRECRDQGSDALAAHDNVGAEHQANHPSTGPSYSPAEFRRRAASRSVPVQDA